MHTFLPMSGTGKEGDSVEVGEILGFMGDTGYGGGGNKRENFPCTCISGSTFRHRIRRR